MLTAAYWQASHCAWVVPKGSNLTSFNTYILILMKLASNAIIAKIVPANHCPQITVTAKLVLYISIYFCVPLIPLEMSISKMSSFSKSYVGIIPVQPNSSAVLQFLQ